MNEHDQFYRLIQQIWKDQKGWAWLVVPRCAGTCYTKHITNLLQPMQNKKTKDWLVPLLLCDNLYYRPRLKGDTIFSLHFLPISPMFINYREVSPPFMNQTLFWNSLWKHPVLTALIITLLSIPLLHVKKALIRGLRIPLAKRPDWTAWVKFEFYNYCFEWSLLDEFSY